MQTVLPWATSKLMPSTERTTRSSSSKWVCRSSTRSSGFAMAGAVAFSFVLSLFPFCIFLGALAGVFGGEARAREGIKQLFEIVPAPVAEALAPEVMAVMGRTRLDLLTFGAFISLFFATSAIESLRAALNVAYRQKETRSYPVCLLQSSAFVIVSAVGMLVLTWGVVVGPELAARFKPTWLLWLADTGWLPLIVRFGIVITAIGLQLLAYHIAIRRGCDVDQPRNLAKSVTVE